MTTLCFKRIMTDIANIRKDPIDKDKIFIYQEPENIMNVRILMIGDSETPYEYGIFYFYLVFPENYPFSPPSMKFITSNGKTRFNPNLYISGKVCISLLNTWQGPKWTACNSLKSLLLSIKSMILGTKYPLENEPGYELTASKRKLVDANTTYIKYNTIIEYQVILHTIIKQYLDTPDGMEVFKPIVDNFLQQNITNIRNKIISDKQNSIYHKKNVFINYQNQSQYVDYDLLLKYFDQTFSKYLHSEVQYKVQDVPNNCEDETLIHNNILIDTEPIYEANLDETNNNENTESNENLVESYNNFNEDTIDITIAINNHSIKKMHIDSDNFINQNISDCSNQDKLYFIEKNPSTENYLQGHVSQDQDQYIKSDGNEPSSDSDVEFVCLIPANVDNRKIKNECQMQTIQNGGPKLDNSATETLNRAHGFPAHEFCNTPMPNIIQWTGEPSTFADNSSSKSIFCNTVFGETHHVSETAVNQNKTDDKDSDSDEDAESAVKQVARSRKCPRKSAKHFDEGTVVVSENDNRKYVVKSYIKKKYSKGNVEAIHVKRWILYKK